MRKTITSFYTLNKCRRILRLSYRLYRRKAKTLDPAHKDRLQSIMTSLQTAIAAQDVDMASRLAKTLEESSAKLMPKTLWDKTFQFVSSILFALVVAIAIRQTWFEFYTIPSGSMRPTLKEADFLLVSKTDFSVNTLTRTSHFYFDPALVKRGSVVIFSGENMDIPNAETTYFYLIPGIKQYIKRLIAKPGDTVYFYGGRIYGVNAGGRDLKELRDPTWFRELEHIPFIRFDGKAQTPGLPQQGVYSPVTFYQMNEPVAKLTGHANGSVSKEMLQNVKNYYDLWGFKNYAMARLLTPSEAADLHPTLLKDLEDAPLYLELTHHPSLENAKIRRDEFHRLRPTLSTSVSLLPLDEAKIDEMMHHMYTCRFVVKNGLADSYGSNFSRTNTLPRMKEVPDGTYELQDGKAYRILPTGLSFSLEAGHPLLNRDPLHVQQLYNLGIEMDQRYAPAAKTGFVPSRYAYFANNDLHLLNAPLFKKADPALILFLKREYQKQALSSAQHPYRAFDDAGPPLTKEGAIDADFIRKYGLTIPDKSYLVLGDNHAMSGDSRQFGFVPQDNLRGGASLILWPPGHRWGRVAQPAIDHLTIPNSAVWIFFSLVALTSTLYLRRKYTRPLKF